MKVRRFAALVFVLLGVIIIAFQIAMALGAPWGSYAMSGTYPGQFPPELRIAAIVQAAIWLAFVLIVLARSGLRLRKWGRVANRLIWLVVTVTAISSVLNLMTPSAVERMIWAPVAIILLITSLLVATGPKSIDPEHTASAP